MSSSHFISKAKVQKICRFHFYLSACELRAGLHNRVDHLHWVLSLFSSPHHRNCYRCGAFLLRCIESSADHLYSSNTFIICDFGSSLSKRIVVTWSQSTPDFGERTCAIHLTPFSCSVPAPDTNTNPSIATLSRHSCLIESPPCSQKRISMIDSTYSYKYK